ncbi:MAG: hypothetical protein HY332_12870 [Chloroflexi bacterium]|nr:hypothetical protein [Chloroflexota bacterium]
MAADALICPYCSSVELGAANQLHAHARSSEARRLALQPEIVGEELECSGQLRGWIGFMPARLIWGYGYWYMRGVFGLGGIDLTDPDEMRWWASRLLFVGAFFAALGVALVNNPFAAATWAAAGVTLLALIAASVCIAMLGPRSTVPSRWRAGQA